MRVEMELFYSFGVVFLQEICDNSGCGKRCDCVFEAPKLRMSMLTKF